MDHKEFNIRIPWPTLRVEREQLAHWLPSRGNVIFTLVMIAVLLWAQSAGAMPFRAESAASTGAIAYQGRLADSAGNPLTSTLNMSFRLYSAASGGAPLWSEQWTGSNGVKVSDGLFNVMLGSLTPIPQGVITGNANLFLGITVGTDDEMAPRVQLGSVPWAVQALTVPDGSISAAKLASDVSLEPPDGSITTAKLASEAVTQVASLSGVIDDTTTSTSMVDLASRSITLNTSGGPVLVLYSGTHTGEAGIVGYWQIVRDGSVVIAHNGHAFASNWENKTVTMFGIDAPPPGSHTYKVQWRVSSGTLKTSLGVYSEPFAVIEFKR